MLVQDAHRFLPFDLANTPKTITRKAIKNHPTRCVKSLALKHELKLPNEMDVIVVVGIVFIRHDPNRDVWTRYTDGAKIQKAFDAGQTPQDTMFALWPPQGTRSHDRPKNKPTRKLRRARRIENRKRKLNRMQNLRRMLNGGNADETV